ncbi:MAG: twin-arginine translocase subunit TatC [Pseudomonadota bacterium]
MTESNNGEMPLISHLIELRNRLMRILGSLLVVFLSLIYFSGDIYDLLSMPIRAALPPGSHMIATAVTASFMIPLKLTFMASIFVAMPYMLFQIWGFVSPALYLHEKKIVVPLMVSSILLFYVGVAFAYFITLPPALYFFLHFQLEGVQAMPDIADYMDLSLKLFLVFGITFEVPIAVFLLIWSGITSSDSLIDKRRYVIVGCFFVSMFLTPPDALSMAMLAVPMWLLFEAGLFFGRLMEKRRALAA